MKNKYILIIFLMASCLDAVFAAKPEITSFSPDSSVSAAEFPRPGMYMNTIVPDSVAAMKFGIEKAFVIWHIMPGMGAWNSDLAEGDTIIKADGKPMTTDSSAGNSFLDHYLKDNPGLKNVTITKIKNGQADDIIMPVIKNEKIEVEYRKFLPDFTGKSLIDSLAENLNRKHDISGIVKQISNCAAEDHNKVMFSKRPAPFRLEAVNFLFDNPFRTGELSRLISDRIKKAGESGLPDILRTVSSYLDIPNTDIFSPTLPKSIHNLDLYFAKIQSELDIAYRSPGKKELKKTLKLLHGLLDPENGIKINIEKNIQWKTKKKEIIRIEKEMATALAKAGEVDMFALFNAARLASRLLDEKWLNRFISLTRVADMTGAYSNNKYGVSGEVLALWENRQGTCVIGGKGPNSYSGDFAFILDIGGDDKYELGQAKTGSFRIVIDKSGNDCYFSEETGIAAGIGALDFLLDVQGNDSYKSDGYSQGAGLLGIGLLIDNSGDDSYRADWCSQGAGFAGAGIIIDRKGNDNYYSHLYSQGFGYSGGMGILIDEDGNDIYNAGWKYPDSRIPGKAFLSMSQGFGFGHRPWDIGISLSGGIGILNDYAGNDSYNADFFSQGASYWYALGILHDYDGADRYSAGQYSQGSGIHLSFGALLDDRGDDNYYAYAGLEQGNAHDWSAGCLEDLSGNDVYYGSSSSQGSALTVAVAYLLDAGGSDKYICDNDKQEYCQGSGRAERKRAAYSFGFLIDLGGEKDFFSKHPGLIKSVKANANGLIYKGE